MAQVDWGRIGEALFIKRERSNLEYLKAINEAEDMKDAAQIRDFQAVLQAKKAEYDLDSQTFSALRQFITDKHNIDLAERQAKTAELNAKTAAERQTAFKEKETAINEMYDRERDDAMKLHEMNPKKDEDKPQFELKRKLDDIEARRKNDLRSIAVPGSDTKPTAAESQAKVIAEERERRKRALKELLDKGVIDEEEYNKRLVEAEGFTPDETHSKVKEAEEILGRELTDDEKKIVAGIKSKESGASTAPGDEVYDLIGQYMEDADISDYERIKLAEWLKPKVSPYSKRNPLVPLIIEAGVRQLASLDKGENEGDRWDVFTDKYKEGQYSTAFQPFLNVATAAVSMYPANTREGLLFVLDNYAEEGAKTGDYTALAEQMLLFGKRRASGTTQRRIESAGLLMHAGFEAVEALEKLEKAGVKIGRLEGLTEKAKQQLLGDVEEPLRRELESAMSILEAQYTLAVSGTAASDREVARISQLFVKIFNSEELNAASVNGVLKTARELAYNSYRGVFGTQLESTFNDVTDGQGEAVIDKAILGTLVATSFETVDDAITPYETDEEESQPARPRVILTP